MAKKQTRRSVSLSKETYNLLKNRCEKEGETMSGIVSQLIDEYLKGSPRPSNNQEHTVEESVEAAQTLLRQVEGATSVSGSRFVVNTDLVVTGPASEDEAEQLVNSLVQKMIKRKEIVEALILSADPE
jgi:hypothetical protein